MMTCLRYGSLACLFGCLAVVGLAQSQDVAGSKDHPMFTRLQNFYIGEYLFEDFASEDFSDAEGNEITVEGKRYVITYYPVDPDAHVAPLKVVRNYTNAIKKIGGTSYEYTEHSSYLSLKKNGRETWAKVYVGDGFYTLTILEKAEVEQEVTANDMLQELNRSGHIALYINFDTGKSDIKPDSQPIVDQILALLNENADLKLRIEGHTDNVGKPDMNKRLSEDRARAVVSALVGRGINPSRLVPAGFGQDKPVADNSTEEGRARNRRVELVKT
ncbi:MAG: OmpA family protein [Acidobacteria bacterium]|nr:OmpA family protein [Acidobacteriota bacterium]